MCGIITVTDANATDHASDDYNYLNENERDTGHGRSQGCSRDDNDEGWSNNDNCWTGVIVTLMFYIW